MKNNIESSPLLPQQGGEQTYPAVTKQQEQDNTEDIELMLSLMTSAAPNAHWPNDMRHRINVGLHYLDQSRAKRKASGAAVLPQVGEAKPTGWLSIANAPKNKKVLVWREDSGPFMAKLISPCDIEEAESDEEAPVWLADGYGWQDGIRETPTHYMELPGDPK